MYNIDIDEEIERDRKKLFAEASLFLNESDIVDNNDIRSNDKNVLEKNSSAQNAKIGALKKSKEFIKNMKRKFDSEDELINGYSSSISGIIKSCLAPGAGAVIGSVVPVLGTAIGFVVGRAISKDAHLSKRKDLYTKLRGDLDIIESKLEDINKKDKLTDEEKKEKYSLMALRNKLDSQLHRLSSQILK